MKIIISKPTDSSRGYCLALQLRVAGDIVAKDGFGALYKGLSAGLLRQATYTTARMGIFNVLSEELKKTNGGAVRCIADCACSMPCLSG